MRRMPRGRELGCTRSRDARILAFDDGAGNRSRGRSAHNARSALGSGCAEHLAWSIEAKWRGLQECEKTTRRLPLYRVVLEKARKGTTMHGTVRDGRHWSQCTREEVKSIHLSSDKGVFVRHSRVGTQSNPTPRSISYTHNQQTTTFPFHRSSIHSHSPPPLHPKPFPPTTPPTHNFTPQTPLPPVTPSQSPP